MSRFTALCFAGAIVFSSVVQATTIVDKTVTVPAVGTLPIAADMQAVNAANGTIMGMVVDSAFTATSIPGAIVTLFNEAGTTVIGTDTSGDDGSFEFDNVALGNYRVSASVAGYVSKSFSVTVLSDAPVTVFVALPQGVDGVLPGRIKNTMRPGSPFAVSSKGMLTFGAGAESGEIAVFGFDGRQLFRRTVNRPTGLLALPGHLFRGKALIVRYSGKGFVYLKSCIIHR
jgi:hypothetical protein